MQFLETCILDGETPPIDLYLIFEKSSWMNLILTACEACKIQVQNRQKIKFTPNLIFQTQFTKNQVQINRGLSELHWTHQTQLGSLHIFKRPTKKTYECKN